jgi:hypothetical protein
MRGAAVTVAICLAESVKEGAGRALGRCDFVAHAMVLLESVKSAKNVGVDS